MTVGLRTPRYLGLRHLNGWHLRCWLLDYDEAEALNAQNTLDVHLGIALASAELCHDPKYALHKVGFVIAHSGRRGVSISICHCGAWETTGEVFLSQFFVDRADDLHRLEPFDPEDPIFSSYETTLFAEECRRLTLYFGRPGGVGALLEAYLE